MLILMTSGTTGPSKAVRCSYAHHAAFGEWYQVDGRGHEHRYLIVMPMFHVGGSGIVFGALNSRGSIAMLPRFSTSSFWADVRALGATVATLADSMAAFLLQSEARPDDDRQPLRLVFMTGLFSRPFAQRFGVETFCGFAMTEAPGPLRAYPLTEGTSCGRPWGGWHARIVDAHDAEVPVGTAGELIIRHETPGVIASGYVDDPEADREAWRDGWFHTGDQMVCDAAGNYYFKDRRKDTLRRRGENISSFEVEAGVLAHHQVLEAAVVAVPAAEGEDDVMAFVVLKEGASLTAVDLIEFLVDQLPHYMVPRYLEFVSELPKTPTEKIKKAELRARGIGPQTWDRERAGLRVKSTRF
jgi:crotonobetaine/carnitine-CoA ligase